MKYYVTGLLLLILLIVPGAAHASDISDAQWKGTVRIINSGNTTATNASVNCTIPSAELISNGFANSGISDIAARYGSTDMLVMPGSNSSVPWWFFVDSIAAGTTIDYDLYTGNVTGGNIVYYPANTGAAVTDNLNMELGDNFTIEIKGGFTLDALNDTVAVKDSAFSITAYPTAYFVNAAVGATNVSIACPPGSELITVAANGANITIDVDGTSNTTALAAGATDNGNPFYIGGYATGNSGVDYLEYFKIWVDGVLVCNIQWAYGTIFPDLSGYGNSANVTFRTITTTSNVTAQLVGFEPLNESEPSTFSITSTYEILSGNTTTPSNMFSDGDYSKLPADPINDILDDASVPRAAWWMPFLFLGICVGGFIAYGATTLTRNQLNKSLSEGQIDGSLVVMFVVMEGALWALGKMGPIDLWPAYLFPIAGIAIILSRKHFSWG